MFVLNKKKVKTNQIVMFCTNGNLRKGFLRKHFVKKVHLIWRMTEKHWPLFLGWTTDCQDVLQPSQYKNWLKSLQFWVRWLRGKSHPHWILFSAGFSMFHSIYSKLDLHSLLSLLWLAIHSSCLLYQDEFLSSQVYGRNHFGQFQSLILKYLVLHTIPLKDMT